MKIIRFEEKLLIQKYDKSSEYHIAWSKFDMFLLKTVESKVNTSATFGDACKAIADFKGDAVHTLCELLYLCNYGHTQMEKEY